MKNHNNTHIIPYKTYLYILAALIVLTLVSVGVTYIEFGELSIFTALLLASVKSILVLVYFMHLKFDNRILQILVPGIFILVGVVIFITFLDYNFR
ncbi:cytochrome c oxidase subunit 4 [Saccharicrinis carchari]|uniref:Cytochrome c oxidase subunit 4 n=1 Tax=Saccharicrinis carchari TaxID=1168039 RepID=A0A521DF66_SACCC|nr:cytochrome C oxidase subunit IV family protein [Saccharicrinis carchari]SMO70434.1 cytochrome c oxidase subunit 4 [Saccharicrinis carchari]